MMTNSIKIARRMSARRAGLSIAFASLAGMLMLAASTHADEQLRLLIMRDAADIRAQGECVRGQLFLVRSYETEDIDRRVRVADTLEVLRTERGLSAAALVDGEYTGALQATQKAGWSIALASSTTELRADKHGKIEQPSVLLGRRAGMVDGACELSGSRLEDGEVIMRRLQSLISGSEGDDLIEIAVRSGP